MHIVDSLFGRFGNNVYQLLNVLYEAQLANDNVDLSLLRHLNCIVDIGKVETLFNRSHNNIDKQVKGHFFPKNLHLVNECKIETDQYFNLAQKYLHPNLTFDTTPLDDHVCIIHIRSGDTFTAAKSHPAYVQPPLNYYKKIVNDTSHRYGKYIILTEPDLMNPCIKALDGYIGKVAVKLDTVVNDYQHLLKTKSVIISRSSFSDSAIFLSPNVENIYFWDYAHIFCNHKILPASIKIFPYILIDQYIKVGEWDNHSQEQLKLMIEYDIGYIHKYKDNRDTSKEPMCPPMGAQEFHKQIHNCAYIQNTYLENNACFVNDDKIQSIKSMDKNNFRYYKFNSIYQIPVHPEFIFIKGTTLRFEILSSNIHHFMYDVFFHFMHFMEMASKSGIIIDNLLINLIHTGPHTRETLTQTRPCPDSMNRVGENILIDSKGKYHEASIHWCNSVFLSYTHEMDLNIIYQNVNCLYKIEQLFIIGEDRGLRYPNYADILKTKVHKFIDFTPNIQADILIYTRSDAGRRMIVNPNQISAYYQNQNLQVKIVDDLTKLSFKNQISLLNNCKVLITPSGANMANILFVNRNVIILEVDQTNSWVKMFGTNQLFNNYYYPSFSRVFNNNRGGFYGSPQCGEKDGSELDDNFIVNIESIASYLKDKI